MIAVITMHKLMGHLMIGGDKGCVKVVHVACTVGEAIEQEVAVLATLRKRKSCYGYNAWQLEIIYKRRRSPDRSLVLTSNGGLSSGSVSKLPKRGDTSGYCSLHPGPALL